MPPVYIEESEPDPEDILIIHDFMDTLDQIPPELTRVHSDLNELGAVLYSTLLNLEQKLNTLIGWIQDTSIGPEQRFQLLQEIAEEAARYKLGGDDKIRVAGGACDGLMAHQRHISNLLSASTILQPSPASPYTQSLTLAQAPTYTSSRRGVLARAVNSPFGGGNPRAGGGTTGGNGERETPTKKKKNRVQALGADDDVSSVGGEKKRAPAKKRRPAANRATSPTDSLVSASAFTSKPTQPQTARQLAAAVNKAKKAERADDSDDDSDDGKERGLGLDMGSREGSHLGGRSANATPVLANASVIPSDKSRNNRSRGTKRTRAEEEEDEEELDDGEEDEMVSKPPAKKNGSGNGSKKGYQVGGYDNDTVDLDNTGGDGEVDSKVYCTCRQVSFGEMIGCDDDDCEIEWYHIQCVGLDKTPEGNWICPQCVERRKRNPKKKVKGKSRK